nr:katanin p80 WD40 repeat-containing subunit B1 homolog isoform X1 [Tanacetum cinerariifolium]
LDLHLHLQIFNITDTYFMEKRAYKLQEFVAHIANVNCVRFGKKSRRNFITGGDDEKVNLWSIGKPTAITSLSGHTSPIESVAFDSKEILVAAGASSGLIKLWDLEETKVVRTLNGHRSYCTSLEFHPFGPITVRKPDVTGLKTDIVQNTGPKYVRSGPLNLHLHLQIFNITDTYFMEKRAYKLQEFVAHIANVNCLRFGKKSRRNFLTGGDDEKVNLWSIGKPTAITSLSGHTSPVESVAFDSKEVLVAAGASSGLIKLWDLEETKGVTHVASKKSGPVPTVVNLEYPKDIDNLAARKQDNIAVSLKPSHRGRPSTTKLDIEVLSVAVESGLKSGSNTPTVANFQKRVLADDAAKDESKEKAPITAVAVKEFQKASSPGDRSADLNKEAKSVKYVNGVAVVHGRTRSLVERFEKREKLNTDESQIPDLTAQQSINTDMPSTRVEQTFNTVPLAISEAKTSPVVPLKEPETKTSPVVSSKEPEAIISQMPVKTPFEEPEAETPQMPLKTPFKEPETIISQVTMKTPFEYSEAKASQLPLKTPFEEPEPKTPRMSLRVPFKEPDTKTSQMSIKAPDSVPSPGTVAKLPRIVHKPDSSPVSVVQRPRTAPGVVPEKGKASPMPRSGSSRRLAPERVRPTPMLVTRRSNASPRVMPERTKISPVVAVPRHETPKRMVTEKAKSSPLLVRFFFGYLMLNHDVFVTTLRSRLTKLQVVRHFWEKSDTRGAINALGKLPDHAVQADVVNVLTERMESLTLDHFSSMLSVLMDLLDSSTERHINVSLEMLLKLVAVFGPVVNSTVSAPPTVGVDLHAEKRRECCKECHVQLQKIHKCLPDIIRRGGLAARCAQELNVILQNS